MMREDPYTRQQRHQISSLMLLFGGLVLIEFVQLFNPGNDLVFRLFFFSLMCILLIIGGIGIFASLARLKRLVQLRESVLNGGSASLASEQPIPDAGALPLPATIELDRSGKRRPAAFLIGLVAALFIIGIPVGIIFYANSPHPPPRNPSAHNPNETLLLVVSVISIIAVIVLLSALILIARRARVQLLYKIVVDEQGLTSTYQGVTASISWSDARLFAITSPAKPANISMYELGGTTTVVCWINLPARPLFGWGVNAASTEYQSKVQALLSLIAARTALPLYDFNVTLKMQKELFHHD